MYEGALIALGIGFIMMCIIYWAKFTGKKQEEDY